MARIPRNVRALGVVSFFTDMSSEMIYPLIPIFLSTVLGAGASFVGAVEGAAETTASLLKLASGWWSDRVRRRKPLVVAGYGIATVARPLVALAGTAWHVLAIRVADRVGKGLRTAPRDALIADSVAPAERGRAFGFHRAADHAGAVVGPLVAYALLQWGGVSLRTVFALAAIPGAIAVVVLLAGVRERSRGEAPPASRDARLEAAAPDRIASDGIESTPVGEAPASRDSRAGGPAPDRSDAPGHAATRPPLPLGGRFWAYLAVVLVFTLGNSTDAFLLLRAADLGVPAALAPILWAMLHVVKSAASTPGGALSDRIGRRPLIVAGWLLYAAVYLAFGRASEAWHVWALFALYGVYFGLTEGVEKALVADIVPADRRGAAFGWYNLAIGVGALPASVLFGAIWDRAGAGTAFGFGAAMAVVAAVAIAFVAPARRMSR
jgi:MFS family permease